jgi:hypothetical protein
MENVVGLKYSGSGFYDANANNGLGEYKAYMVVVKEGHEGEAQDKMRAFASAGTRNGTRVRDGVIAMSRKQLEHRIAQLDKLIAEAEAKGVA